MPKTKPPEETGDSGAESPVDQLIAEVEEKQHEPKVKGAAGPKGAGTEGLLEEVLFPLFLALLKWWKSRNP